MRDMAGTALFFLCLPTSGLVWFLLTLWNKIPWENRTTQNLDGRLGTNIVIFLQSTGQNKWQDQFRLAKEIDFTFWKHELQRHFTQGVDTRKSEENVHFSNLLQGTSRCYISCSLWDLGFPNGDWIPGPQQWKHGVLTNGPPEISSL